MNVLIVHAHNEPKSFCSALKDLAVEDLRKAGHQVRVSDLYAMNWNPVAGSGVLIKGTGQDTVAGLAGAVERLPLTMFAFALAGITLMGLPPSAGFLAKWQIIEAALAQGYWPIVVVVLAGGLLAAVYVLRVLRQAFLLTPVNATLTPVPRALEWSAFALAAASVLLGLRGVELMQLLGGGT